MFRWIAAALIASMASAAFAADVKVLAALVLQDALDPLVAGFARDSRNTATIAYSTRRRDPPTARRRRACGCRRADDRCDRRDGAHGRRDGACAGRRDASAYLTIWWSRRCSPPA